MRRLKRVISRMPIKWKLTLWSALLLFMLFAAYNMVQYVFVDRWMISREEMNTREDMREILNYFLENEVTFEEAKLVQIRNFLEKVNHRNQLIRVLDKQGNPIVIVTDDMPDTAVEAKLVPTTELIRTRNENNHLLIMRSPLTIFQFSGTVEIVKSMEDFEQLTTAFFYVMAACGLGSLVLSGLGGWVLSRQLLKPLQSMVETMKNVKQKGLQERVQVVNNQDEIAELMNMFNRMMDQVERSFQQQRQFVEDASHELRTPIAIVEGHLALLQRWGKNDPAIVEESMATSMQELARLKSLVQELLALSRAENIHPENEPKWMNPDQEIRSIIRNVADLHPSFQFEVDVDAISQCAIAITLQHLEQILLILLDNAVKYSGNQRLIQVKARENGDTAYMEVTDYGIGITEGDMPYVMDRFYRADKARGGEQGGYGLGLSIAKRLVEQYGGAIRIQSLENEGTTIYLSLPLVKK
jgi:two-component system sensor histidine kinase ArlS